MKLRADQRDMFLVVVDALAAGTTTLKSRLFVTGHAVNVAGVLFGASASTDRLPGMVGEMLRNLYQVEDAPRLYGEAARLVLLEHPALQVRRDETAEMEAMARSEAHAEQRKLRAQAKSEADKAKARAARREARERKALRAAA